jgi:hypothetical protein
MAQMALTTLGEHGQLYPLEEGPSRLRSAKLAPPEQMPHIIDEGDSPFDADALIQRAVILQTLCHDHADDWTQPELEQTLDTTSEILIDALIDLEASNVIDCVDGLISASRCAKYLDAVGLITP